jgi:hypothetical protein
MRGLFGAHVPELFALLVRDQTGQGAVVISGPGSKACGTCVMIRIQW